MKQFEITDEQFWDAHERAMREAPSANRIEVLNALKDEIEHLRRTGKPYRYGSLIAHLMKEETR